MRIVNTLVDKWFGLTLPLKLITLITSFAIITSLGYFAFIRPTQVAEVAIPVSAPVTPPFPTVNYNINWQTPYASLEAENIEIVTNNTGNVVDNVTFNFINADSTYPVGIGSDPYTSHPQYTTLSASWHENNVEMQVYMFFGRSTSPSGQDMWQLVQIKTYDGRNPAGWVDSYSGGQELFALTPIGTPLVLPSIHLSTSGGGLFDLRFTNLRLQGFLGATPSIVPSPTPSPNPSLTPCIRNTPTISLISTDPEGLPGETLIYTASITNNDSQPCGSSLFTFSPQVASGFNISIPSQDNFWIPAGATAHLEYLVTSPLTNPYNTNQSTPVSLTTTNTSSSQQAQATYYYNLLQPEPQTLDFSLKLAGVTNDSAEGAMITVKVYLKDGTVLSLSEPIALTYGSEGVYHASALIDNPLPPNTEFRIKIKGEKHLATLYCQASGQTGPCGDSEYMTTPSYPQNTLPFYFASLPLTPGDLYPQDGSASLADLNLLKPLMSKPQASLTDSDLLVGDVNYDSYINIKDVFLILKTLETRYDD